MKLATSIVGLVLIGIVGAGAYKFAEYRVEASKNALYERISKLDSEVSELKLAVAEQNAAVALAQERERASEAARRIAATHAETLSRLSHGRIDKLTAALESMETCGEALHSYWELRR